MLRSLQRTGERALSLRAAGSFAQSRANLRSAATVRKHPPRNPEASVQPAGTASDSNDTRKFARGDRAGTGYIGSCGQGETLSGAHAAQRNASLQEIGKEPRFIRLTARRTHG